eukprot:8969574-Pyramimonas_sp.AAC.1
MKAIDLALTYDGLDIGNPGAFELMLRKAQLIEYSYSEMGGGGKAEVDGSDADKKGKGRGGLMRAGLHDEPQIFMG